MMKQEKPDALYRLLLLTGSMTIVHGARLRFHQLHIKH